MKIVIVNEATTGGGPLFAQITPAWLTGLAAALVVYSNRDVAAYWPGTIDCRFGSSVDDIAPGETILAIVDSFPQNKDAIAYHDIDGKGAPYILVSLSMCKTLDDVSMACSHELAEALADPSCNVKCENVGTGKEYAQEICDPDEGRGYRVAVDSASAGSAVVSDAGGAGGYLMSDFVLPAFFDGPAPGPYTFMGSIGLGDLVAPFTVGPGGYMYWWPTTDGPNQVFGMAHAVRRTAEAKIVGTIPPLVAAKHAHWSSRIFRRLHPGSECK
jgi:hypothetical protein